MTAFYFTLTFLPGTHNVTFYDSGVVTPPHFLPLTQSCAPSLLADSAAAARFFYFLLHSSFKEAVS